MQMQAKLNELPTRFQNLTFTRSLTTLYQRLEKDKLKEFSQLDQRFQIAKLTHQVDNKKIRQKDKEEKKIQKENTKRTILGTGVGVEYRHPGHANHPCRGCPGRPKETSGRGTSPGTCHQVRSNPNPKTEPQGDDCPPQCAHVQPKEQGSGWRSYVSTECNRPGNGGLPQLF